MSALSTALQEIATSWSGQIQSLAESLAPAHVRPAISVRTEVNETQAVITISASKSIVPDAIAQELGSGLRATQGPKKFIDIYPKRGTYLIFDGTNAWAGQTIFTKHVNHPGINPANEGKGYIMPAVQEVVAKGKAELSQAVRSAISVTIKQAFTSAK
jgi:hypothetical protein